MDNMRQNISKSSGVGLVLSGGGVRGMAHIGAIKALEESGIQCSHISGASVGALVGAFYAGGYPWQKILEFFKQTSIFRVENFALGKPGFIDTEKFYDDFLSYFPTDHFSNLQKQLFVSVTDIVGGVSKIVSEGPLINTILASAAFSVVLTPLKVDGTLLADGGILNNFAIEPLVLCPPEYCR